MKQSIELTNDLEVSNNAHILYLNENSEDYINNLIAYIKAGIERNHHVIIIENPFIFQQAKRKINPSLTNEKQKFIHHVDNYTFYRCYRDFHIESILEHFGSILEPFFKKELEVRTWAQVEWMKQENIENILETFENTADCKVNELGLMSVCAYNANNISASLQTSLMRNHEYIMTDKELFKSTLYKSYDMND
ncbi:MEDS domain-containing protein [Gracilibacillus sp. YIM 98692]|uniref:MEDS domain-containing protein n=1 Tax=Gracilibacillus sp. YIM 98692 TaxID=2663532 RepID=UPI0013D06080|nr:MEDS domain-containing protein [Gracilibacillus sp. YIM 98692]